VVDDDAAPRQRAAADAGGDRVDDRVLRRGDDLLRQILVAQPRRIFRELYRLSSHPTLRRVSGRLLRCRAPRNGINFRGSRSIAGLDDTVAAETTVRVNPYHPCIVTDG